MRQFGFLFAIFFLILIIGCGRSHYRQIPGYPRPYKVHGKWYQPIPSADGFSQKGRASWYGKKFHGRKTANGEIYNMYAMTAAHKTLPLGTWLRVKNLENGKEIDVRVNDRGPFVGKRIIDLSYTAATRLAMTKKGTAEVKIKTIKGPSERGGRSMPSGSENGLFSIQAGSFSDKSNAKAFMASLDTTYKNVRMTRDSGVWKVRVGKFKTRRAAEKIKAVLKKSGYAAFTVQE